MLSETSQQKLSRLSDFERERYYKLLTEKKKRNMKRSLSEFIKQSWRIVEPKTPYIHGWHIDSISEHLEAVSHGEIRDLLINMPPRHMKSSIVSVMWPAWTWATLPWKQWLYSSYAASLSQRDSVKCRSLVESEWYKKVFDIKWTLAEDQNTKGRFDNTEKGYRIATSVGGSVTGEGGDIMVCDDPHSAADIHSEAMRESVLRWWDETMSSRGNDPKTAARVIVMQRLHEMDLSGHVLTKGGYEHLSLPAEFETKKPATGIGWEDPRKTPGELLWPERFGPKEIAKLKIDLGSQAAAGQLQQRPAPAEGNIVKRVWWKYWDTIPESYDAACVSADLTFKDKETSDFVVFTVWFRKGANKYLVDMVRARMSFTESLVVMQNLASKWPRASARLVEDAANGAALIDTLKNKIPGIIPVQPKGSKLNRAMAVSPQIEAGNIFLPDPKLYQWVEEFIEEWAVFPNGANDDIVDSSTQAISYLTQRTIPNMVFHDIRQESKWLK